MIQQRTPRQNDTDRLIEAEISCRQKLSRSPSYAEGHGTLGNILLSQGRLADAEASYRRALEIKPDLVEVHCNLGVILKAQGRLTDAEASYRSALAIKPDYAEGHGNLGNVLKAQGRLTEAEASYRHALLLKPNFVDAHGNLGSMLMAQGRVSDAEACYRRALVLKPDSAELQCNLGVILRAQGRLTDAEAAYRHALVIKPNYAEAYNNLGNILKEQDLLTEAEDSYRQALVLKPNYVEAYVNQGNTLRAQCRFSEAETSYRQALKIKPDHAEANGCLGVILKTQGRFVDAEACYRRAIEINPDYADAHGNLGVILNEQGRYADAEASCRRALEIKPDYAEAYSNLGNTFKDQGRFLDAEASYRRALEIKPDYAEVYSNLLLTLNYAPNHSSSYYLEEACRYGQMISKKAGAKFADWQCMLNPSRIRVGVVSGDLRNHPVGIFMESMLSQIDLSRIELIAYPTDHKVDELTKRITPYFSAWKSLVGLSDEAAAHMIHSDGVHLLLDLSGHTAKNRLPLFAWKPAPVQFSWLGYPQTTGVREIDYILADALTAPPEEERLYSEKVWRMPDVCICFTPPILKLEISSSPILENNHITFGCFNNPAKINDKVLGCWVNILHAVPKSVLILKHMRNFAEEKACKKMLQTFQNAGIGEDRIYFEGYSPHSEFYASYNRIDFALDPFPYNGVTTTCEALWMGVPTLTLKTSRGMISHNGEMIMKAVGLADWVAESIEEYIEKAVKFSSNPQYLTLIRSGLRDRFLASPLCDAPRFAQNFEVAVWDMWRTWCKQWSIDDNSSRMSHNDLGAHTDE